MKEETILLIVAIVCLTAIQIVAIYNGVNGILRATIAAAIAGIVGWRIPMNRSEVSEVKVRL